MEIQIGRNTFEESFTNDLAEHLVELFVVSIQI